jgi:peptidoglycan hydrolase-like protein with peptidoglycan-binding domain
MNKIINSLKISTKLFVGAGLTLALAAAFIVSAPQAKAAEVNIVAGQNLTIGSSGQSVIVLQGLLSEMGYLNVPAGVPFGYFGPLTQAAVGKYQSSINVAPTAGFFGSLTKVGMYNQFAPRGWLTLLGW